MPSLKRDGQEARPSKQAALAAEEGLRDCAVVDHTHRALHSRVGAVCVYVCVIDTYM